MSTKKKQVIIAPIITESSLLMYRNSKVCTFWVDVRSSKKDIAVKFEGLYGIKPISIRTALIRKRISYRNTNARYEIQTSRKLKKKAYIDIGQNVIDIFENIK
ncbi:MAG: hypothetical protein KatS3mg084_0433 [Candidatus Dojkabacteria bacterium]|nr:MAG: hypothetical protein KatS3mg084_0433 [Candidatus Dojkabacteria bacterium]